ncbi:MAG: hypothetical protein ABEJ56_02925 [Candidatus Nanohaloarchaea archaeon]
MNLSEEYRKEVERIGEATEQLISKKKAFRLKAFLDQILPVALLSLTFVVLFGLFVPVTEKLRIYITYLNWGVIVYFAARLAIEFRLSSHRDTFFRTHWLDFLLVVPAVSVLREVRTFGALSDLGLFDEEALVSAAFLKELGVSAQLTKISRIVKKSIGF